MILKKHKKNTKYNSSLRSLSSSRWKTAAFLFLFSSTLSLNPAGLIPAQLFLEFPNQKDDWNLSNQAGLGIWTGKAPLSRFQPNVLLEMHLMTHQAPVTQVGHWIPQNELIPSPDVRQTCQLVTPHFNLQFEDESSICWVTYWKCVVLFFFAHLFSTWGSQTLWYNS